MPSRTLPDGLLLTVKAQPGARRAGLEGLAQTADGPALKVKVAAPPEEGRANEAILTLLAEALEVKRRAVTLVSGASSRLKRIKIEGDPAHLTQRLAALIAS